MRKFLSSITCLLTLTVLSFALGLGLSIYCRNFDWLARFGALVICWGILLLARPSITGKEIGQHIVASDSELSLFDPAYYAEKRESVPEWALDNLASRRATGIYGPIVCFLGTLTNGFASLLNVAFGFAS